MERIEELENLLQESDAYAAIVYGSYARDEDYNDIDVAVFTDGSTEDIVREAPAIFDIQRFQDLPMYVRHRILDEGEVIYMEDEDRFYDETIKFVKDYESFKPRYREYLEGVKHRG